MLASGSPRRLAILRSIGIDPTVVAAAIDEQPLPGEKPTELVERLALSKARAVSSRPIDGGEEAGDRLVVGADTVIDLDGRILGKPADRAEAESMLVALAARSHAVVTGVAVVGAVDGRPVASVEIERTEVEMRAYGVDEIAWYLDQGEYEGKAGAYAIQGLGSLLVRGIEGSYQNVVGLPLTTLDRILTGVGRPLRELVVP